MKLSILTFITSLAIAAVAAWYSIIGLTTIFSAAVVPIIIMGVVLEIGKLVAAAWVYQNWKETNVLLKSYLVSAIVVLMLITSMGIYGFLSKSHIDAGINTTEISVKLERLDNRINGEQRQIDRAEKTLKQLDDRLEKMNEGWFITRGIQQREKEQEERQQLNNIIKKSESEIDKLLDKKSEYQLEVKNFEVEVGPIKYIAALVYGDEAKNYLDNTVRYVILLLIFVFDPLAVLLLISANQSYRKELEINPPEEKGLPVNVGKTVRSATVNKGVKKVTKERDGVKIHYFEEDDGKG
jgi:hypothetical protein|tara:strand:- start:265 stop:1152 length:888 start_codon:yes stop_codon:yes gene_type:complete